MSWIWEEKQKNRNHKRKTWRFVLISLRVLLLSIIIFFGYQLIGTYNVLESLDKPKDTILIEEQENEALKPAIWEGTERVSILLMGGDNRGLKKNDHARSDSMLVVTIDPTTKKAHLMSVLRDTYVEIEGHGKGRINTALALGGPTLAMKTIGDLLGLDIQYYVYTDFEGFKSLIDVIGGIDFYVEKNMDYTDKTDGNQYDIHLRKGQQMLDGDKALQYVRFRHDAMSDFTRTERQRNLLLVVAEKLKSDWNLFRMKQILESVAPYIQTNLNIPDMLKLAKLGVESHIAGSAQVPPMELIKGTSVKGASVLSVQDNEKLREFVQELVGQDK
ncbi:LCP family protein [Brevibacillus laterosporus]|uniref:LCP family protein n=1 Tax=Brevibacillus halotolerans TaxID=1507437 RepID=A0ABT4HWH0_9BACL|nr:MULTISPECIES: LCP family protein [Brevibacillus]MCR8985199.1 LCP family protein [Brevibacillus laterosporus]MCZ0830928.1 LCP family protein [Brevibacillus halotolerans]GIO00166.1 transcriptional regulator [Brevibacillus halotolerans]